MRYYLEGDKLLIKLTLGKGRLLPIVLALLLTTCLRSTSTATVPQSPAPVQKVRNYHEGRLTVVEGVKLLKLSGSYYEMGKQYGVLMKDDIKAFITYRKVHETIRTRSASVNRYLNRCTPKRYQDFMKGMSDGSEIPWKEIFGVYTLDLMGCSSILVKTDHHLLLGHNQDRFTPSRFKILVEFNPDKGYKHIISTFVGTCEVLEGMNEKGISLTQNKAGYPQDRPLPAPSLRHMFPYYKYWQILDSAASIAEVDRLLKGYQFDGAGILIIGSGSETDGAIYDITFDKIIKNRFAGKDFLFATNHYLNKTLNDHPEECIRYQIIADHFRKSPVNSVDDMIGILSDPGSSYGVNNNVTIHSLIFDPQDSHIYFTFAPQYAAWGEWLQYDWPNDRIGVYRMPSDRTPPPACGPVTLKRIATMKVASIRDTLASGDGQSGLWTELGAYLKQNGIEPTASGFTIYHNNGKNLDLEAVQPVAKFGPQSSRVKFTHLRSTEMVCVTFTGPLEGLDVAFYAIYKWILEKGFKPAGTRRLVWVKGSWNEKDPRKWVTEVQVPVKR